MPRFVRFMLAGEPVWGTLEGSVIERLVGSPIAGASGDEQIFLLEKVQLVAPVSPSKIICVGLNYASHVKESQSATVVPEEPILFMKPPTAIIGPGENIMYPPSSSRVDHEAELAVVIGKTAHNVAEEDAASHIWGYTCLNDVTARDLQKKDGQWTRGKGFDTFCPIGPSVVTGMGYDGLVIESYLNGERKQSGNTSDMIFKIPFLISYISRIMTLLPGDVIATGTPAGISPMQPGDTIEIRISGIGSLINQVVETTQ